MRLSALILAASAACGSGYAKVTVGGQTLTVYDQGYRYAPQREFCSFIADQQLKIELVDYKGYCGRFDDAGFAPGRDINSDHLELSMVLGLSANQNHHNPFTVSAIDCKNGPGDLAQALFMHYPAGNYLPDTVTQADSGKIYLNAYDPNGVTPAQGTYDIVFGAEHVTGSFSVQLCK